MQLTNKIAEDKDALSSAFDKIDPYLVTDCSTGVLSSFQDKMLEYAFNGIVYIDGDTVAGENGVEFYPDKDDLTQKVIDIFYMPE